MAQFNFEAIGTAWVVDIYGYTAPDLEAAILADIKQRIGIFDKTYSRFRSDSLVSKMSKTAGIYTLPDDAEDMMSVYRSIYELTGGLVTPLIGNLISDAGYDAAYSLTQKGKLSAPPAWDEALEYRHPAINIKQPVLLDFGAAGKGYLIDLVAKVIESNGVFGYCIDAGGDILHKDAGRIRIGLENPDDSEQVVGIFMLGDGSICGSAGNRRAWGDFTHIINPKTLSSPRDIKAVWVNAKTSLIADALATCLFFVPADKLKPAYEFEYLLLRSDNSIEKSPGFAGEVFVE